jgi:hypothetical protein
MVSSAWADSLNEKADETGKRINVNCTNVKTDLLTVNAELSFFRADDSRSARIHGIPLNKQAEHDCRDHRRAGLERAWAG